MRISHVQNSNLNNKYSQPSFGIWTRGVYKQAQNGVSELTYRNDTMFFRDPEFWRKFTELLEKKFEEIAKANVYCYGCSDGSEAYTFAMSVMSKGENFANKFLPVIARDIDSEAVVKGLNNDYEMTRTEFANISFLAKTSPSDYFRYSMYDLETYQRTKAEVLEVLRKKVTIGIGDIFEDYKNINPQNAIVLARNFWPYIEDLSKRSEFFKNLYSHLNEGSLFVIGNFDISNIPGRDCFIGNVKGEIKNAGFEETELENVFEKK